MNVELQELPLVSVIIPTYKRTEKLSRALDSILSQTYSNIEVVLVNDNGKDKSFEDDLNTIVNKYSKLFHRFTYIKNDSNMGPGKSRNNGVKKSLGDLVTFLDDDDIYLPQKIEKQVLLFENSQVDNLAAVYCQLTSVEETSNEILSQTNYHIKGNKEILADIVPKTIAGTPTIMIKKDSFISVSGFRNLKTGEDWCLLLDLILHGYGIDYNSEHLVITYEHNDVRVTQSHDEIYAMVPEILEIKKNIISKSNFSTRQINKIYFWHYYQLASRFKYSNKKLAVEYIIKASSYSKNSKELAKFLFSFILGNNNSLAIKKKFQKITSKNTKR